MIELILFCTLCAPQRQPQPPRVVDRKFIAAMAVLGTAKAADAISTQRLFGSGGYEMNPIFGPQPSIGRFASVNAAYFSGEVALAYALKRYGRRHRWARYLWLVEPSFQIGEHIHLTIVNMNIQRLRP